MNEIPMIPLWRRIAGWLAVTFTTAFACLRGFWGSIEAFHEGWHERELWRNIALTLGQYLLFPLLFLGAGTLSVLRPKAGAFLFLAGSLWAMWFFNGGTRRVAFLFIALPRLARDRNRLGRSPPALRASLGGWHPARRNT